LRLFFMVWFMEGWRGVLFFRATVRAEGPARRDAGTAEFGGEGRSGPEGRALAARCGAAHAEGAVLFATEGRRAGRMPDR
jgi:hypothetical protein